MGGVTSKRDTYDVGKSKEGSANEGQIKPVVSTFVFQMDCFTEK